MLKYTGERINVALEQAWPRMTMREATAKLCAPGALFEMEEVEIRGVRMRTWKNAPQSLPAMARRARAMFGSSTFLVFEDERVTYEGWFRAAALLAHDLRRNGVGKGDRVALAMRNLPEWPVAFFAIAAVGAIAVPLNAWWTGPELAYGLSHSGSRLLICDQERWERVRPYWRELPELDRVLVSRSSTGTLDAPVQSLESVIGAPNGYGGLPDQGLPDVDLQPDDDATIFYTSGTTGLPKGALGTHRNILLCTLSSPFCTQRAMLRRGDQPALAAKTSLIVIPLFHVTACNSFMMSTIMQGGTMIFMRKWDAEKALEIIERERVNITGGVPTIAWQLLEHPKRGKYDLSSLEVMAYGGAPSAPELVRRLKDDLGIVATNGWGMTETSATVTLHGAEDYLAHPDSCGPALPISDLKIMDPEGNEIREPGVVGELWAFGPQIVKGYWNDPEATASTFHDGWVRTGDLARLDEDGFCVIVDRAKDIVIRGGENIYCCEVENALYDHPAVIDAALVGIPDPRLGEVPAAVVHLADGMSATEAELQNWIAERLAGFKVPVRILMYGELLPRNANGKILKKELRELFSEAM